MPTVRSLLAILISLAAAGWTVSTERDRMTDKTVTWASAQDKGATLLVGCMNGKPMPRLVWGQRIGWGDIGVSYRLDSGPVVPRIAMVSQDGRTLYAWPMDGVEWLRKGKRLRVQVSGAVYDFDLVTGEKMPARWDVSASSG